MMMRRLVTPYIPHKPPVDYSLEDATGYLVRLWWIGR
jgi:hypothetical protein